MADLNITNLNIKEYSSLNDIEFDAEYILYVGDRRNHKNLIYTNQLLKSFKELYKKEFLFIIAGSNSYKNCNLQKIIESNNFVKEIICPNDEYLDYLYKND